MTITDAELDELQARCELELGVFLPSIVLPLISRARDANRLEGENRVLRDEALRTLANAHLKPDEVTGFIVSPYPETNSLYGGPDAYVKAWAVVAEFIGPPYVIAQPEPSKEGS